MHISSFYRTNVSFNDIWPAQRYNELQHNSMQIKFASNSTKRLSGHWGTKPRKIREVVNFILTWPPCQIWNLFSWFGQNRFRKSSVLQDVDLLWCSETQMGHVMWGGEVWNRMCSTYAKQEMKQPRKDVLFEFNPVPQISLEKPLLTIQLQGFCPIFCL